MGWQMFAKLYGQSLAHSKHSQIRAVTTFTAPSTLLHHSQLLHLPEPTRPSAVP